MTYFPFNLSLNINLWYRTKLYWRINKYMYFFDYLHYKLWSTAIFLQQLINLDIGISNLFLYFCIFFFSNYDSTIYLNIDMKDIFIRFFFNFLYTYIYNLLYIIFLLIFCYQNINLINSKKFKNLWNIPIFVLLIFWTK